ncbi:hypothetical protein K438DRAFT_1772401 [Mycena galopus ATCC 62051]|nr:hypothetical protein K438DRAFT_1772401 [Mycena galopus ATCC 62051]
MFVCECVLFVCSGTDNATVLTYFKAEGEQHPGRQPACDWNLIFANGSGLDGEPVNCGGLGVAEIDLWINIDVGGHLVTRHRFEHGTTLHIAHCIARGNGIIDHRNQDNMTGATMLTPPRISAVRLYFQTAQSASTMWQISPDYIHAQAKYKPQTSAKHNGVANVHSLKVERAFGQLDSV